MWSNREKRKRKLKNDELPPPQERFTLNTSSEAVFDFVVKGLVVAGIILGLGFICSIGWPQVFNTFFRDPDIEVNPESQGEVPTLEPDPTSLPETPDLWTDAFNWLSQEDARNLRQQRNVNNLAFLEGGNVLYSTYTVPFTLDQGWRQLTVVPLTITAMHVTDTMLVVQAAGQEYELNVLMPFVFVSDPQDIYLVDRDGKVWQLDFNEASFVEAPGPLTIELAPNPNLSFTINER